MTVPLEPDILTDETEPKPLAKDSEPATPRRRGPRASAGAIAASSPAAKRTPPYNFSKLQVGLARGLKGLNVALTMTPWTKGDQLDDVEILIVSTTAAASAETNLRLRKLLLTILENGGAASLMGLLALVVARRLARHGVLLPYEFDVACREFLNETLNAAQASVNAALLEMETVQPSDAAPNGTGA